MFGWLRNKFHSEDSSKMDTSKKPSKKRLWTFFGHITNDKSLHIFLSITFTIMASIILIIATFIPYFDAILGSITGIDMLDANATKLELQKVSLSHSEKLIGVSMVLYVLVFLRSLIIAADEALKAWKSFVRRDAPPIKLELSKEIILNIVNEAVDKKLKK